jgi:tetratricopeptide (TPR) repeat protein
MKLHSTLTVLTSLTALSAIALSIPVQAEDLRDTQQLMNSGVCQQCDLSRAGLVLADLAGADLSGSDLTQANLNQANLRNANLSGANLSGANLYNADLTGANLSGANLSGADLRDAYLADVNLEGANLQEANLLGASGLSSEIATAEQLYLWGLAEVQRGNMRGAIAYYNQALDENPEFAHAVMARGIARYRLHDLGGALSDSQAAEQLYLAQGDDEGHQISVQFTAGVQLAQEMDAHRGQVRTGGSSFAGFIQSITGVLLRFVL